MKSWKQFLAGVLGTVIAARHVGVRCAEIVVMIDPYDHSLKLGNPDFIDWVGLVRAVGPDEYLRKRMFVLCARAWAEALVIQRDTMVQTPALGQFWSCWEEAGDASIACEIAIVHLTRDRATDSREADSDAVFSNRISKVILEFGLKPIVDWITKDEFLCFVDGFCQMQLDSDGSLLNGCIRFGDDVAANYLPGTEKTTVPDGAGVLAKVDDDDLATGQDVSGGKGDDDVRCLFAHELGHWIAAHKLGIWTSVIELAWLCRWDAKTPNGGHCTIHLNHAAAEWDNLRYLEARISVLAAGALADYSFRHPGEIAIGDGFYKLLRNGTGRDDFLKMRELLIVYVAIKFQGNDGMMSQFSWPLSGDIVLQVLVPLMRRLALWDLIRSDRFRAFVTEIIDTERSKLAVDFVEDSEVRIRMRTARVAATLARHHDLHAMARPSC